ncbi:MAG: alpha/beta hydrolase [Pseudomonadota bacterium]
MPHVSTNGVELFYEDFGDPADPAILLVMGLGTQLIAWPDGLVDRLVAGSFRVIRYDNRDIGQSTHLHGAKAVSPIRAMISARLGFKFPVAYTLTDMAADAIGLLDALGIERAHLVGASMGGMIAQLMAANWPDRVLSLTSVRSSSGAGGLPGPAPQVQKMLLRKPPSHIDRATAVKLGVEVLTAIGHPDPARPTHAYAEMAGRAYDRGFNPLGTRRQLLAIVADGNRSDRLAKIAAPTLIIHGAADPLIPFAHAEDLVKRIPGARLERIDQMAHDLPPSQLPHVADLVLDHARAALPRPAVATA